MIVIFTFNQFVDSLLNWIIITSCFVARFSKKQCFYILQENLNIQTPGRIRPAEISDLDFVSPPLPPPPDLSLPMSSPQPRKLGAHEAYDERPLPAMKRYFIENFYLWSKGYANLLLATKFCNF